MRADSVVDQPNLHTDSRAFRERTEKLAAGGIGAQDVCLQVNAVSRSANLFEHHSETISAVVEEIDLVVVGELDDVAADEISDGGREPREAPSPIGR